MSKRRSSNGDKWMLTSSNPPHTILNDYYSDLSGSYPKLETFPNFDHLPTEIRWAIWHYVLPSNRFIRVRLASPNSNRSSPRLWLRPASQDRTGKKSYTANYEVHILTNHRYSPLLAVNQDARQATLRFYRVHIPRVFRDKSKTQYIYFSPEADILHVDISSSAEPEELVEFLADVKSYDPRGIGVQNLSVGGDQDNFYDWPFPLMPSYHENEALDAFKQVVFRLKNLYFTTFSHQVSRTAVHCMCFWRHPRADMRFHRGLPLNSTNEEFILLDDPRHIHPDLDKVCLGKDPRSLLYQWIASECAFGINRSRYAPQIHYLVAAKESGYGDQHLVISSRQGGVNALGTEKDLFKSAWNEHECQSKAGCYFECTDAEKRASLPLIAAGFWLLPLKALGDLMAERRDWPLGGIPWLNCVTVDLRKYRPKLGLYNMS